MAAEEIQDSVMVPVGSIADPLQQFNDKLSEESEAVVMYGGLSKFQIIMLQCDCVPKSINFENHLINILDKHIYKNIM